MRDEARQHYGLTLGVLTLAAVSFALMQTMVAPALPEIQRDLGASTTATTWVITVYLLTASVATPILGRVGDMFGKGRTFVAVLLVFALGTLVAALSDSLAMLIAGRAIQGAAGAIFPLSYGIVRDEFPAARVPTAIGLVSATFGIGGGVGVVLAGVIVDHLPYVWLFWLSLPPILAAAIAAHLYIPESPVRAPARIDWLGAILLSAGLAAMLIGVSEGGEWGWGSASVLGLFTAAAVVLAAWVAWERRAPQPLVDMRMMRLRGVWTTNATALLVGFGMFGTFVLVPQLVQTPAAAGYGFGASVTESGLFLLPASVAMLVAGPSSGLLSSRFGPRLPVLLGVGALAVSYVVLAAAHGQRWEIYVGSGINGLGVGMALAAMATAMVAAVSPTQTGVATGMNTIMRSIGGALGAQVAASVIAAHAGAGGLPAETGYTQSFWLFCGIAILALVAAAAIPGVTRPARPAARREAEPARA